MAASKKDIPMESMNKQRTPVELPADSWISHWQVTRAIAEAFFPDRRRASGVALITHKALKSGPGEGLPYKLTQVDRAVLARNARSLPSVSLTGTNRDWEEFAHAFARMEPDVNWIPCRPSEADLYAEYCEGKSLADEHLQSLRSLIADKEVRAINDHRAPVRKIAADTMIARADLEKYLADCQISFTVLRPAAKPMGGVDAPNFELAPIEAVPPRDEPIGEEPLKKKMHGSTGRKFSPEQLEYLISRQARGEPWSTIAGELNIELKALERHLTRYRKEKAEESSSEPSSDAFSRIANTVTLTKSDPNP